MSGIFGESVYFMNEIRYIRDVVEIFVAFASPFPDAKLLMVQELNNFAELTRNWHSMERSDFFSFHLVATQHRQTCLP